MWVPQCDNRCNVTGAFGFIPVRNVAWHSQDSTIVQFQMEITSIQDKNIVAGTHDGNYANYMQILGDAIVDRYKR